MLRSLQAGYKVLSQVQAPLPYSTTKLPPSGIIALFPSLPPPAPAPPDDDCPPLPVLPPVPVPLLPVPPVDGCPPAPVLPPVDGCPPLPVLPPDGLFPVPPDG